jgi:hypothetical protein
MALPKNFNSLTKGYVWRSYNNAPNLKFIYLFLIMDGSTQFVVYSTPNFHESTPIGHYRNNIYYVMDNFYL